MILTTHKTYKDLPPKANPNQGVKEVKKRSIKKVEQPVLPDEKKEDEEE